MATEYRAASCSYHLDERLTITEVGHGWDHFALENGAPELIWPAPLGRPLMLFVADATTVHLTSSSFSASRASVARSRSRSAAMVPTSGATCS